jgi:hypothetical protein
MDEMHCLRRRDQIHHHPAGKKMPVELTRVTVVTGHPPHSEN